MSNSDEEEEEDEENESYDSSSSDTVTGSIPEVNLTHTVITAQESMFLGTSMFRVSFQNVTLSTVTTNFIINNLIHPHPHIKYTQY